MASSLMDWTPTSAAVLQNASSRGIKRTFDDFSRRPESTQTFNPYAGQYMPGGWPASPETEQINDRVEVALMFGALCPTGAQSHEDRSLAASPEVATNPLPQNIIFRAFKRFCLGIASQFPIRRTIQAPRTSVTPKPKRSSGTPSSSPGLAISSPPSSVQPKTPQASSPDTFLSSNILSTPDLSDTEEEPHDAHIHNANQKLVNKLGLIKIVTPPGSKGEDFDSPFLRCANPKLLRKLGLVQSPTPPDSPKDKPTYEATKEHVDEAVNASLTSCLTPPPTPPAETFVYSLFRPAAEVILRSPYPKLIPSLSLRSPSKLGQTPLPEQHSVYSPASTLEHSVSDRSTTGSQPPTPVPLLKEVSSSASTRSTTKFSSGFREAPSVQLLAETAREHSPIVELSASDPFHTKSPSSPPMSGELSAEQRRRYTTRSRVKEQEEAAKKLSRYNIEPLSKEWEAKVEHALKHGHDSYTTHDLIKVVPPMGSKTTSQWLNDETINGYLKLITDLGNKGQNSGATPKYHAFTSFFMTTLLEKGYEGVKRWSKRVKIDGKKLYDVQDVFIPVNRNLHWTVLVVSPKKRTIRYYDSLGGNGRAFVAAALQWLRGELGTTFVEGEWMIENAAASPMQNNGSDCGVFAITTAKQLMLGRSPMGYGAGEIPTQRRRIVAELVAGKLL